MKHFLFFLTICAIQPLFSQVSFDAEVNRKEMSIDETLVLNYIIRSEGNQALNSDDFNLNFPDIQDFSILSTRNWNEDVMINGKRQQSIVLSLILKPNNTGRLSIPEAGLRLPNGNLRSPSFEIQVNRDASHSQPQATDSPNKMKKGFLAFEVSNKNPYRNENILGELVFYAVNPFYLENVRQYDPPKFEGFTTDFIEFDNTAISQKKVNGRMYYARTIYRVIMSPTQSGTLIIDPSQADILVGDGFYGQRMQSIHSGKVKLNVRELPQNAPKYFTGAVGDFNLKIKAPQKEVATNSSFDVDIQLKGNGNFTYVKIPEIHVSSHIEKYKPGSHKDITKNSRGESGEWIEKNVMVAHEEGEQKISIDPFVYFNPKTGKYVSIPSQTIALHVNDNGDDQENTNWEVAERENESEGKEDTSVSIFTFSQNPDSKTKNNAWNYWVGGSALLLLFAFVGLFFYSKKQNAREEEEKIENTTDSFPIDNSEPLNPTPQKIQWEEIAKAYQAEDKSQFYSLLEKTLNTHKEVNHFFESYPQDTAQLKRKIQELKYAPVYDKNAENELYESAEKWYQKHYA